MSPPDELSIHCPLVEQLLVRFLQSEIHRAGFTRAVVGLSGGIDSTVVTYLAARALGSANVLAVTMPYKTSSDATRNDAQTVIVPFLNPIFNTQPLSWTEWQVVIGLAIVPAVIEEITKWYLRIKG